MRSGVNWIREKDSFSDRASVESSASWPSRAPFEDAVSAREEGDQELLDHPVLPDDDPGQLAPDAFMRRPQLLDRGEVHVFVSIRASLIHSHTPVSSRAARLPPCREGLIPKPQTKTRCLQSVISDPQSAIRNPQSAICNLQSAICNLQSVICNL
jgi:hypothetical protein